MRYALPALGPLAVRLALEWSPFERAFIES